MPRKRIYKIDVINFAIRNLSKRMDLFSGNCGTFAQALNNILGGKGKYMAILEEYEPEYISHIVLKYNNVLWDGSGRTTIRSLRGYGFNEDHPYQKISIVEISLDDVLQNTEWWVGNLIFERELLKEISKIVNKLQKEKEEREFAPWD